MTRMVIAVACLAVLMSAVGAFAAGDGEEYKPKFAQGWSVVDRYIQGNWDSTLVESEELPEPFTGVWGLLFYWDTYFTNAGLLLHEGRSAQAKKNVDCLLFEVEKYGFVPNASARWGTNRSQPPYLSMMVREVYEHTEPKDKEWLKKAYDTLKKEYYFWIDDSNKAIERNTTAIAGLSRYFHHAGNDEITTFYRNVLVPRLGYPADANRERKIKDAMPYVAEAESGMDFTPRFEGRCPDFVALDLNCNLYMYEKNFAWIVSQLGLGGEPNWEGRAEKRKALINKYCWDEKRGLFMDYDYVNGRMSKVAAVMAFSPLWAGLASKEQAKRTAENLRLFECEWGITVCEKTQQQLRYQWDWPAGWAPLHYIVIAGLDRYGYKKQAQRIASRYLDLVTKNYFEPSPASYKRVVRTIERKTGRTYEKYNVVDGTIYDAEYPSRELMGWSAGVFAYAYHYVYANQQ
jgi:alpha,alpha-trehalase